MTQREKSESIAFNAERLSELSKLAIGSRTLREFANQSGLSEGFLSRITCGRLKSPPTRRSLAKMTADESQPEHGVTYFDLMEAAGYEIDRPEKVDIVYPVDQDFDQKKNTSVFPSYLAAFNLERTHQIGHSYSLNLQSNIFTLESAGQKTIIGLNALCDEHSVDDTIKRVKWDLVSVLSVYGEDIENLFFTVITNQEDLYKRFDEKSIILENCEFAITLTEDMSSFSKQRAIKMVNYSGEEVQVSNQQSFNFTK